jgi:hypothetical protein
MPGFWWYNFEMEIKLKTAGLKTKREMELRMLLQLNTPVEIRC